MQHPRYIAQRAGVKPDARTLDPIVMEPAGTIAGRVVDAVTGQPVPRVLLASQLIEDHHRMLGGWGETRADDQGRFAISGLEPGVYNLLFENAPGRPRATAKAVEGVRVRAGQSTAALMKVIEGRPLRGVVINRATKQPAAGVQVGYCGRPGPGPELPCKPRRPTSREPSLFMCRREKTSSTSWNWERVQPVEQVHGRRARRGRT